MEIAAVVLDLDGVLIDSEAVWDRARREVAVEHGGTWRDDATRAMQGMSAPEWSAYLRDRLGAEAEDREIAAAVGARVIAEYDRALPLLPGATEAVAALAERWPLALASSANREVIDHVVARAFAGRFDAVVSSEEVPRGKPAPDVYLAATARLGVSPVACAAVEDSTNGLRAAHGAGMRVIAVPNPEYPPAPDALALAAVVVGGIADVSPALVAGLAP